MTIERIEKAIDVLDFAIKHNISAREASLKNGYASTYIKNVKRSVIYEYESANLDEIDYKLFMNKYANYSDNQQYGTETNKVTPNTSNTKKNQSKQPEQTTITKTSPEQMEVEWKGHNDNFDEDERPSDYGYPNGHIKTLEQLIERTEVDLSEWVVERFIVNKWDCTSFQDGYPTTWENFQVKATLNRVKEVYEGKKIADVFEELVKEYKPPVTKFEKRKRTGEEILGGGENNLLEVNLFDLHMGKLGWAGEVGENYDTKIAAARFMDAMSNLIRRADGFGYNKILFPIGNDFFNSDNQFNTTTAGTPQDEDLRWQKTFKVGCQLIIDGINMLKEKGVPIDVVVIPGNHDWERSYFMGTVIDAWFRDDPQVNVNNDATPRKYYEFGEVLLGLTHGKEEKENSLPLLMATEQKEAWGRTTFHEWHLGHFHKKRNVKFTVFDKAQILNEETGVTVRYLSSLSGTEEWHFKKGFVGSQKAGEAFVWNDKTGMVGHLNFNFTDFDREH